MVLLTDDTILIEAAQAGDQGAFEELVRRHQLAVYRVALRMLGNRADAEDAAQDALVGAWRALPGFRMGSSFSTWLYRIVTNRCLSVLRRGRIEEQLPETHADSAPGPHERAEARDRLDSLKAALAALTPEQRAALVLREFEGLRYDEIGEVLGLSEAAVKGRLHRARLELADRVRERR